MYSQSRTLVPPVHDFTVVIPFYNEAANVRPLLEEVRTTLQQMTGSSEVVAVNDGSTDDTWKELVALSLEWPALRIFDHFKNRGQAAALWTGFAQAKGGIIVTLDGDGQNDPADIPRLLAALEQDADMVSGIRAVRKDSTLRRMMSKLANHIRGRLLRDGIHDSGCALKAFRREVCHSFVPIRTLYSFMPAMAVAGGFRVKEMPVNHRERTAGVSKYGLGVMLWRPLVDMLGVWWFITRRFEEGRP